jgi:hypothetical protein
MPRKNGWKREHHYPNLEDSKDNLNAKGRVKIGVWTHEDDGRIEHIFVPDVDEGEFIVRQSDDHRNFDEEGRYQTRQEGNRANKSLMEKYPPGD